MGARLLSDLNKEPALKNGHACREAIIDINGNNIHGRLMQTCTVSFKKPIFPPFVLSPF